jgi:hypothetical protein
MDLQTVLSTKVSPPTAAVTRARRRRRSLRRAVQLEVEVMSDLWEGAVPLSVTNLSLHGLWLESELALSVGDELQVAFEPPQWTGLPKLETSATVARVSLLRRRRDPGHAGMGLCFGDLSPATLRCLDYALRGLPPPLTAHPARGRAHFDDSGAVIRLDDGVCYLFCAEAPLLSAGRPIATQSSPAIAETLPTKRIALSCERSPMTAIFKQRAHTLLSAC